MPFHLFLFKETYFELALSNGECQMSSNRSSEKGANTGEVGEVSWEELGLEPILKDGLVCLFSIRDLEILPYLLTAQNELLHHF